VEEMRFIIKENLTKKERKKRPEQFIEKDFENKKAAQEYAGKFCEGWKKITIREVKP